MAILQESGTPCHLMLNPAGDGAAAALAQPHVGEVVAGLGKVRACLVGGGRLNGRVKVEQARLPAIMWVGSP
jgi:hypothetical protein